MIILYSIGFTIVFIFGCICVSALCAGISDIKDRVNRWQMEELNAHTQFTINGILYIWDDTNKVFQAQTPQELDYDELAANYF